MDHLQLAIKSLSPKERALLLDRIKSQKKKHDLFVLLSRADINASETADADILSRRLGYQKDNINNLYTLRNRLHNDITEVKMSLIRNRLIKTKEVVHSLRSLIYSKDPLTVLRELKRQEKNAIELELYDELSEVYFCFFLIYRHNIKKSEHYLKVKKDFDRKRVLHEELEVLFYSKLLDTQDLIYRFNPKIYAQSLEQLEKAREIYQELGSLSAEFLYLSAKLTLHLNTRKTIEDPKVVKRDLDRLNHIYNNTFLIYKYPNCDVATKSLFSRYFLLMGHYNEFQALNLDVQNRVAEFKDYPMFACTYFYYVYSSLHYATLSGKTNNSWFTLINQGYMEMSMESMSDQAKVNLLYLKALASIFGSKLKKAIGELEEARMYFNRLSDIASWIIEEVILLQVLLQIRVGDFDQVEQQLKNYKRRKTRKSLGREISKNDINALHKAALGYEKDGNLDALIRVTQMIKSTYSLLKPVDVSQLLNTQQEARTSPTKW